MLQMCVVKKNSYVQKSDFVCVDFLTDKKSDLSFDYLSAIENQVVSANSSLITII